MSESPLVSIGMPVFNCQSTLALALRSMLAQTYANWELFLIDDGSTDATMAVATEFSDPRIIRLADGRRCGLAARLNQAVELSRGRYFARMDGDDVSYPERLARQVTFLETRPEVDLLGAAVMVFTADGTVLGRRAGPLTHAAICARPTGAFRMFHPTYLGRLAWFRRYPYDPRLRLSQDQVLLLSAYRRSTFANLPDILLGYREEKLALRKILWSRWFFVRAAARQFGRERRWPLAVLAGLEHGLKGGLDILAIGTGLNYTLLPQRAQREVSQVEAERWQQVWRSLQGVSQMVGDVGQT